MTIALAPTETSGALERVVATAKRMEQHDEIDRWQFADDVLEAVDEQSLGENGFLQDDRLKAGSGGTGFYRAVDAVNDRLREAQVTSVGRKSIVAAYATAKSWPEEDRVEGANYWAHYELRAREYDRRRRGILERLVQKNDRTVSTPQVRLWKSDQKHDAVVPFLEQIEQGVRGFLKRKGNPWTRVADEDAQAIARMLRIVAAEIADGEFGR